MPFRLMLDSLVRGTRGARGAVFCDYEGEAVEHSVARPPPAGCAELTDYDLKVCGAQMAAMLISIDETGTSLGTGAPSELRLICSHGTLLCSVIKDRYYVALLLAPGGRSADATRRLNATAQLVAAEM